MNERTKQTIFKVLAMEMRELPAFCKSVMVDCTFIFCKKVTGYSIHDQLALLALFDVSFGKHRRLYCKVRCDIGYFSFCDINHQRSATCTAACTIYSGTDLFIELMHHSIYEIVGLSCEESPKGIIFILTPGCHQPDGLPISFYSFDR